MMNQDTKNEDSEEEKPEKETPETKEFYSKEEMEAMVKGIIEKETKEKSKPNDAVDFMPHFKNTKMPEQYKVIKMK